MRRGEDPWSRWSKTSIQSLEGVYSAYLAKKVRVRAARLQAPARGWSVCGEGRGVGWDARTAVLDSCCSAGAGRGNDLHDEGNPFCLFALPGPTDYLCSCSVCDVVLAAVCMGR